MSKDNQFPNRPVDGPLAKSESCVIERAFVPSPVVLQEQGAVYLAPLLNTPLESSTKLPRRADLLRRALTSHWRLAAAQRAAHAEARSHTERSCHVFGAAPRIAAEELSVPHLVDRRSIPSAVSQRSLFTVDGLPETLAPDPSILTIDVGSQHTGACWNGGTDNGSSQHRAPHFLQHVVTVLGAVEVRKPELNGMTQACHQLKGNEIQDIEFQIQAQDDKFYYLHSAGVATDVGFRSEGIINAETFFKSQQRNQLEALNSPFPYSHERNANNCAAHPYPYLGRDPNQRQLSPSHPLPQEQQQPTRLTLSSATSGAGLLSTMHHLLHLPGGPDPFLCNSRHAAFSTELSPQSPAAVGITASAAAAAGTPAHSEVLLSQVSQRSCASPAPVEVIQGAGTPLQVAAVQPPLPAAQHQGQPSCDDARNPMSFNYDPSLEVPKRQNSQVLQQNPGCTALSPCRGPQNSYGNPNGMGEATSGTIASRALGAVHGTGGSCDGRSVVRARADDVREVGSADPLAVGSSSRVNRADTDAVVAEGPFVVLEMKGPRGTPSTRAAATAAFQSGASASPAAPDAAVAAAGMALTLRGRMTSYFSKWRGVGDTLMPADKPVDVFWSWLGAFLSILSVAVLNEFLTPRVSLPLMIASFGASAVLLFGVPASKLSQPRNFLGGQVVSAVVGVLVRLAFMDAPHLIWLSAALGMSLALAAMQITRTVHPPGGASALIASSALYIGPWYGFKFVLTVIFGCFAMLLVAVGVNNLSSRRRYPTYWIGN